MATARGQARFYSEKDEVKLLRIVRYYLFPAHPSPFLKGRGRREGDF